MEVGKIIGEIECLNSFVSIGKFHGENRVRIKWAVKFFPKIKSVTNGKNC